MKIFWSWQSDTHQPSGRYFVREVLQRLCDKLADALDLEQAERPQVDHDTFEVAGSPPIAETILQKIADAAVFVADVTPVTKTNGGKHVANPNVMIELGYALAKLRHARIVLVMNTADGASVKHLPFDLRHWRQPISYSLKRDATDEQRAEVANELTEAFRQAIVPSLKVAASEEDAKRRSVQRMPELDVEIDPDSALLPYLKITQLPATREIKSIEAIRDDYQPLRFSGQTENWMLGLSLAEFGQPTYSPLPSQWTKEEIDGYNRALNRFYERWDHYVAEMEEWSLALQRTFEFRLVLANKGSAPATNIDVDLTLPAGLVLHSATDEILPEPEAPEPPPFAPYGHGGTSILAAGNNLPNVLAPFPRSTTIEPEKNLVRFRISNLKHGRRVDIAAFKATFRSGWDIKPFAVKYVITANEPLKPTTGQLHIDVKLNGEALATDSDDPQ
ncbi:TIR domain-containing protein [Rhizobium tubonense]|uniref:Uncharacterized protein n=1 Tax=Rhizobium tubonense TaxID=484088 RepID=A0A2W4DA08_9HYPH|nr:TIR domain-containing protein [Rhizobium tubonense]PZM13924.1 hypothetical protein CPY51_13790 [Rhizobium tubonense]